MSEEVAAPPAWPPDLRDFEPILNEILEYHIERFYSKQTRARAEVGPSILGGGAVMRAGTGTDYWTMDYAKENTDYTLHDVNKAMLEFIADRGVAAELLIAAVRPRVAKHLAGMMRELTHGLDGYANHEYGMRPPATVSAVVERHVQRRQQEVFAAVSRGVIDPRLAPKDDKRLRNWLIAGGLIVFAALLLMI